MTKESRDRLAEIESSYHLDRLYNIFGKEGATWLISELKAAWEREERMREAVVRSMDHCLCDRATTGFDYGETHMILGKPRSGARWNTPKTILGEALSACYPTKESK